MENLKEYMLIFRYKPSTAEPTEEQLTTMHKAWEEFIRGIAKTGNLMSTAQLGTNGRKITPDQKVEEGLKFSENEVVGGNMMIRAESLESAIALAKNCPILLMEGNVEVRDAIPMNP